MRYSFVLFDAGETLISPRESFGAVYTRVLQAMGHPGGTVGAERMELCLRETWAKMENEVPRGADRYSHFPGGEQGYWFRFAEGTLARATGRPPEKELVLDLVEELGRAFREPSEWRVFPDVLPALRALREEGFRLAVVSNWDSRLPGLLEDLRLAERFDTIVVSHLEGVEKPDPELFRRALRNLGAPPEKALHVGDLPGVDLDGARAAGIDAVLLDRRGRFGGRLPALPDLGGLLPIARGETPIPAAPPALPADWSLEIFGQVQRRISWSREEFLVLPRERLIAAPSGGRQAETSWEGVSTRELLARLRPMPDAAFVLVHDSGGKTIGFSLAVFARAVLASCVFFFFF